MLVSDEGACQVFGKAKDFLSCTGVLVGIGTKSAYSLKTGQSANSDGAV